MKFWIFSARFSIGHGIRASREVYELREAWTRLDADCGCDFDVTLGALAGPGCGFGLLESYALGR